MEGSGDRSGLVNERRGDARSRGISDSMLNVLRTGVEYIADKLWLLFARGVKTRHGG